ncbi:MAG: hypothetical protein Q8O86_05265 [Dehalococcoidia bacterium]|nr:hypothetical protein [Dehalococcoidia bacterium]
MVKRASIQPAHPLFRRSDRPAPETESDESKPATRQSAIFLEEQQLDWLEDRCREARKNGGRAIRKAAIIRGLLDVAMESSIDLKGVRDQDDLMERIRRGLRAKD